MFILCMCVLSEKYPMFKFHSIFIRYDTFQILTEIFLNFCSLSQFLFVMLCVLIFLVKGREFSM